MLEIKTRNDGKAYILPEEVSSIVPLCSWANGEANVHHDEFMLTMKSQTTINIPESEVAKIVEAVENLEGRKITDVVTAIDLVNDLRRRLANE